MSVALLGTYEERYAKPAPHLYLVDVKPGPPAVLALIAVLKEVILFRTAQERPLIDGDYDCAGKPFALSVLHSQFRCMIDVLDISPLLLHKVLDPPWQVREIVKAKPKVQPRKAQSRKRR